MLTKKVAPSASRRRSAAAKESRIKTLEMVVRRGSARRFNALKRETSELPVVVTWDRREDDRREGSKRPIELPRDRRATERRDKAPFTWALADFIVVNRAPKGAATRKKKAKSR